MIKIKKNTVKFSGMIALFCLSLACFTYINSLEFPSDSKMPETTYVEELTPETPEVLPDVQLVKAVVKKALEFISKTNF